MKIRFRLAVSYAVIFIFLLGIITLAAAPFLLTKRTLERTAIGDFSVTLSGDVRFENGKITGCTENSVMEFERFKDLCAEAVFDEQLIVMYRKYGMLSAADAEGEPFYFCCDSGYTGRTAYTSFSKLGVTTFVTLSVIGDDKGGCLAVFQSTSSEKDYDAFSTITKTVDFT